MKILFAAFRHDPQDPTKRQGADYQFLQALKANGFDCHLIGPFLDRPFFLERIARKIIRTITRKPYLKHDLTNTFRASGAVTKAVHKEKFDLVFSLYPAPLAFYQGNAPVALRTDATILGVLQDAPEFISISSLVQRLSLWVEKNALKRSILVVTHSDWSRDILIQEYHLPGERIFVFPNPSAFSLERNETIGLDKDHSFHPLRLLFVGQDPRRKGLDLALRVVEILSQSGQDCLLTVIGLDGVSTSRVRYLGKLKLDEPSQFSTYRDHLRGAHLLLHPARFDPAPRVTSEAAAFGTPTITNAAGGLATSVMDGVSGIVLPKGSPPEAYVQAIKDLISDPVRYQRLCQTTRERYERELNWGVAGPRLVAALESAVQAHRARSRE